MNIKTFFNKKWKVFVCIFIFTDIFLTYFMGMMFGWPPTILELLFWGFIFTGCLFAGIIIVAKGIVRRIKNPPREDVYEDKRPYENPLHRIPYIPPMKRERDPRKTEQRQRKKYFS